MDTRVCSKCKQEKPASIEYFSVRDRGGWKSWCKKCMTDHTNRPENKQRRREYRRQWKYGITPEELRDKIEEQRGLCLICQEPLVKEAVDHDHATGQIRGILCYRCNTGLGLFRDSVLHLTRAINYLQGDL